MNRIDRRRAALDAAFTPTFLQIDDDSHLHAGHAGARSGRGHYRVEIVSTRFAGLALLARHRAVYEACEAADALTILEGRDDIGTVFTDIEMSGMTDRKSTRLNSSH